jgi:hypothetical protein
MEDFNWMALVAAVAPIVSAVLGSLYLGWKAKVLSDGITDWQDYVVTTVDELVDAVRAEPEDPTVQGDGQ